MSNHFNYYQFIISFSDIISECKVPKKRKKRTYKEYQKIANNIKSQVNKEDANVKAVTTYIQDLTSSFEDHCKIISECLDNNGLTLLAMNFEYKEHGVVDYNHMHFFVAVHRSRDKGLISIHKRILRAIKQEYQDYLKVRYSIKDPKVKIFEDFNGKKYTYCNDSKKSCRRLSLPSECPNKSRCPYVNKCIGAKGSCPNYIEYVDHGKRDIENVLFYLKRDKFWEQFCGVDRHIHKKGYSPQCKKYYYENEAYIREYSPHPIEIPELRENPRRLPANLFTPKTHKKKTYSAKKKEEIKGVGEPVVEVKYTPQEVIDNNDTFNCMDYMYIEKANKVYNLEDLEGLLPGVSNNKELLLKFNDQFKFNHTDCLSVISVTKKISYEDFRKYNPNGMKGTTAVIVGKEELIIGCGYIFYTKPFHLTVENNYETTWLADAKRIKLEKTKDNAPSVFYSIKFDEFAQSLREIKSLSFIISSCSRNNNLKQVSLLVNLNLEWLPPTDMVQSRLNK